MTDFTLFETLDQVGDRWSADVPDDRCWDGMSGLSDSDGNDLEVGMMVKFADHPGWYEVVGIRAAVRQLDLEATDGMLWGAMASEVTVY